MEKKEDEDITRDTNVTINASENIVLNYAFTSSQEILELRERLDEYGEDRLHGTLVKAELSHDLAEACGGDGYVAKGIAIGLELGKPNYGETGLQFVKKYIPDYSSARIGAVMIKKMLSGKVDRMKKLSRILEELEKIAQGSKDLSTETLAAQATIECLDLANEFPTLKDRMECNTVFWGEVLDYSLDENGSVPAIPQRVRDVRTKEPRPKKLANANTLKRLNTVFSYYTENPNEIPEEYRKMFEERELKEVIALYCVTISEDEMDKVCGKQSNKIER